MILGFASLQGFVLSALLLFNKRSTSPANKLIGLLVFCFSLMLVEEALEAFELNDSLPKITGSGFFIELLLGPLTYIYARQLAGKRPTKSLFRYHMTVPVVIILLYGLYHLLVPYDQHFLFNEHLGWIIGASLAVKISFQVTYQLLSIRELARFRKSMKEGEGDFSIRSLATWIQRILTMVLILIPMVFLLEALNLTWPFDSDTLTSFIMIFSIYSVGYLALNNPMVYPRESMDIPATKANGKKYDRSALTDEKVAQLTQALLTFMETEKPFLDPELTADQLAQKLNMGRHQLSQVLNQSLQQGFYEFINSYRVKAFMKLLQSADLQTENILSIGFEAGFNSKATLNRSFKKVTGTTPMQYLKNLENKSQPTG